MKFRKRIAGILLTTFILLTVLLPVQVSANAPKFIDDANNLKALGLFLGTSNGFDLDKPCDRLMGAVLFVRFLGREKEVIGGNFIYPFTDVKSTYADKYVGYLYMNHLSNGQSADKYGTAAMSGNEFATLILRALGYKDNIDFKWTEALDKLASLGIITIQDAKDMNVKPLLRDQAVHICYSALYAIPVGDSFPLVKKMLYSDVFSTEQMGNTLNAHLMLASDFPDLIPYNTHANTTEDLKGIIELSMENVQITLTTNVGKMNIDVAKKAYNEVMAKYHWKAVLGPSAEFIYSDSELLVVTNLNTSDYLEMEYYYKDPERYKKSWHFYRKDLISDTEYSKSMPIWAEKVNKIVSDNTKPQMSEFEKEKALHDYLVLNTKYDGRFNEKEFMTPHFAMTVIFNNHGVCDGYAEAFKILMNGAGIECKVIYGNTPYGLHAWNQVKVDGAWYNVDTTWDDPDKSNNISFEYLNVSDDTFLKEHWAEKECNSAACTSNKYNYLRNK